MDDLAKLQDKIAQDAYTALNGALPNKILEFEKGSEAIIRELDAVKVEDYVPSAQTLAKFHKEKMKRVDEGDAEEEASRAKKRRRQETTDRDKDIVPKVVENPVIAKAIKFLSETVTEGLEILTTIKTWVQLSIPRIEDGNNFGVGVQEECIGEMSRVEDAGFAVLDNTTKYHQQRARLVHKMVKHCDIADYRQAVIECDETQIDVLKLTLAEVRNSLTVIHDLIVKNFDKVSKPRTESTVHMY